MIAAMYGRIAYAPTTDNESPTTDHCTGTIYRVPTTDNESPTTDHCTGTIYRVPRTDNESPTTDDRRPTTNEDRSATCNLGLAIAIQNPKSKIQNPSDLRPGLSPTDGRDTSTIDTHPVTGV